MWKRLKILAGLVVGSAAALLAGLIIFAAYVFRSDAISSRPIVYATDGIVILTGGEERLRAGLKLFEHAHGRRVLISGVNPSTSRTDVRRMFDVPQMLADCCLDLGYAAQNTVGNALETRDWAQAWGFQRLILVTSDFHIPRSLIEIKRVLPDVEVVGYPVGPHQPSTLPWWRISHVRRTTATEYAKFLKAAARFVASRIGVLPAEPLQSARHAVTSKVRGLGG